MNPAMREKLDCVKDHLEDSRAKVDAAEAEMRGVMLNLRERRRAGAHQRSVGELHELLHGVRIEQQRTQRSLAASQQLGRTARSTALSHILVGTYLRSLRRAWAEWERAAAALASTEAREHRGSGTPPPLTLQPERGDGRARPSPAAAGHSSLRATMRAFQRTVALRESTSSLAATGSRQRQYDELRAAHELHLVEMAEELEEESRRARRREQRGISLALGLLPRAHGRRRLQVALSALREWTRCAALQRAHEQQLRGLAATVSAHGAARDAADAARAATEAALAAESERWRVGAEESARLAAELRTRDGELAAGRAELERLRADGAVREQALELALQTQRDDASREAAAAEAVTGRGGAATVADALGAKAAAAGAKAPSQDMQPVDTKGLATGTRLEAADPEAEIPEGLRARATRAHSAELLVARRAATRSALRASWHALRRWWAEAVATRNEAVVAQLRLAHESEVRRRVAAVREAEDTVQGERAEAAAQQEAVVAHAEGSVRQREERRRIEALLLSRELGKSEHRLLHAELHAEQRAELAQLAARSQLCKRLQAFESLARCARAQRHSARLQLSSVVEDARAAMRREAHRLHAECEAALQQKTLQVCPGSRPRCLRVPSSAPSPPPTLPSTPSPSPRPAAVGGRCGNWLRTRC